MKICELVKRRHGRISGLYLSVILDIAFSCIEEYIDHKLYSYTPDGGKGNPEKPKIKQETQTYRIEALVRKGV